MGHRFTYKNLNDDQPNEPEIELELEELREGMREIKGLRINETRHIR